MAEQIIDIENNEEEYIEIITQKEFKKFGIDESYVPYGAVVSKSNPYRALKSIYPNLDFLLQNKYGRDPWGGGTEFGVAKDIGESEYNIFINIDNPQILPREKNEVLRKILLKTVSQDNKIYYIIPGYLAADLVREVRCEKEILAEIIKTYFSRREKSIRVGTLEEQNSLLLQSLKHIFPQIKFVTLNFQESISLENKIDIFYFTDASFHILFRDTMGLRSLILKPDELEYFLRHIFYLIYNFLKPEGKIITISMNGGHCTGERIDSIYKCIKEFGWWQLVQPFFWKIEIPEESRIIAEGIKQNNPTSQVYFGQRRESKISVPAIEKRLYDLDLPGVPLSLVSIYKNSFSYLIDVLLIFRDLIDARDRGHLRGLTEIQRDELETICSYQREKKERFFQSVASLIEKIEKLREIERIINPGRYQRARTPVINNLDILPLFNFEKEEIEEIILIVAGHSTMSGVVSGKLPGTALKPITGKVLMVGKEISQRQISFLLDILENKIFTDNRKPISEGAKKFLEKILAKRKIANEKEIIYFKKIINEYRFTLGNYFLSSKQVFELVKRDYLKSIVEFAAGGGGVISAKKVERFAKLWREASGLIYNSNVTWESIMEEKITNMGGTFWMSLRRLLRIFEILKIDPLLMKELDKKTDFEIEAIAGHDKEMVREYRQAGDLIRIAKEFRDKYYNAINFDRPFFYRILFEKFEIHGTGRIFPFLSAQSGFKLLWIACHAAKNNFIDFNPMITDENQREWKRKIKGIEDGLNLISIDKLNFSFLDDIKKKISEKEEVLIFNTGLELRLNEKTDCLEFRYSNVLKTIEVLNGLLDNFKKKQVTMNNLKYLMRLEDCCNTVLKYPSIYREGVKRLISEGEHNQKLQSFDKNIKIFETVINRLRKIFIKEIFNSKEIGANIYLMSIYCPKVMELALNRSAEFKNIKLSSREHFDLVNEYVIRIAKKFQAVATKTKSEFQDKTVFNRIAQEDFGEKTPVSIEISEKQLDILEGMYEKVKENPEVINAMMAGILFFNIGKIPLIFAKYRKIVDFVDLQEAEAEILQREKFLKNLVDGQTEKLAIFFIKQVKKMGQIIKKERPLEDLTQIIHTHENDMEILNKRFGFEKIFTANCILSILATASEYEGLLTFDLMEKFFSLYQTGLSIIRKEKSIPCILKDDIYDKGKNAFQLIYPEEKEKSGKEEIENLGKEAFIVEILFSFRKSYDVFYHNVLEFNRKFNMELSFDKNGMPGLNKQMAAFIKYLLYKTSHHSVGIESFTKQMRNAIGVYNEFKKMPEKTRRYFAQVFIEEKHKARFLFPEHFSDQLTPKNMLKIVLLGSKALDYRKKAFPNKKSPYISFFNFNREIECNYDFINKVMDEISYAEIMNNSLVKGILENKVFTSINIKYSSINGTVEISCHSIFDIKKIISNMKNIKSGKKLERFFAKEITRMRQSEYNTNSYQEQLTDSFLIRREDIKNTIVENWQKKMARITLVQKPKQNILFESIRLLKKLEIIFRKSMQKGSELDMSVNQFLLLRDAYEITREKIRLSTLKNIICQQNNISSLEKIDEFTKKYILFIDKHVKLFGKEISWVLLNNYKRLKSRFGH